MGSFMHTTDPCRVHDADTNDRKRRGMRACDQRRTGGPGGISRGRWMGARHRTTCPCARAGTSGGSCASGAAMSAMRECGALSHRRHHMSHAINTCCLALIRAAAIGCSAGIPYRSFRVIVHGAVCGSRPFGWRIASARRFGIDLPAHASGDGGLNSRQINHLEIRAGESDYRRRG